MFGKSRLDIYILDDAIIVKNQNNDTKQFPRCGITKIQSFVLDMAKKGQLDELL
ncbi:hypothetical protein [Nitrosopumilus maritimus]|uniref:hypothetical protein n=1 Tax=Nitrosopumilus maritimus TaxID=338192 RepID=UPI000159B4F7|nr:hypothetical protein [Nitrosopumilus maritimus]